MGNKFRRFGECNDWEGETWYFYIPVSRNEVAIDKLAGIIKTVVGSGYYCLSSDVFDESEIDVLIKHEDDTGYMSKHNKLSGILDVRKIRLGKDVDTLYKGGIKNAMRQKKKSNEKRKGVK